MSFLPEENIEYIIDTTYEKFLYQSITLNVLYETEKGFDYFNKFIYPKVNEFYNFLADTFKDDIAVINNEVTDIDPMEYEFDELGDHYQQSIERLFTSLIKLTLKAQVLELLKDESGCIAAEALIPKMKESFDHLLDSHAAIVLIELKHDGYVDFIEAKFGDVSIPYGSVVLIERAIID